jgi:hypothetical protein
MADLHRQHCRSEPPQKCHWVIVDFNNWVLSHEHRKLEETARKGGLAASPADVFMQQIQATLSNYVQRYVDR